MDHLSRPPKRSTNIPLTENVFRLQQRLILQNIASLPHNALSIQAPENANLEFLHRLFDILKSMKTIQEQTPIRQHFINRIITLFYHLVSYLYNFIHHLYETHQLVA